MEQWNEPTSSVIKPGKNKSFALKFILAPTIRQIEEELITQKRPVAVGIPGYVVPQGVPAKLFLNHGANVKGNLACRYAGASRRMAGTGHGRP